MLHFPPFFGESNMRPFYITAVFLFHLNEKHKKKSAGIISYIAFQVSNPYCTSSMLQWPRPSCLKLKPPFDLCISHRIPSWLETGLCCWSCSARYKAGRQAPTIKKYIAQRKQISSGASQFKSLTWEADPRQDAQLGLGRTYKVPSSKNPVKVQVLVGPDKSLGALALATVQRLSWQAQEALQSIPSETSPLPQLEKTSRH